MDKKVKISEMPPGKTFEDYPNDTIFVLDEDDNWNDIENPRYNKFWELIQKVAARENSKFFMDSGEGNELMTEEFEGEDFSGWLVPLNRVDIFKRNWSERNAHQEEWDKFYCYAEWKEENGFITIEFNRY